MNTAITHQEEGTAMDHIDVRDLSEEQAQLIAAFVEFLRVTQHQKDAPDEDTNWRAASIASFAADWDNDEDAIYDDWHKHYHVQ